MRKAFIKSAYPAQLGAEMSLNRVSSLRHPSECNRSSDSTLMIYLRCFLLLDGFCLGLCVKRFRLFLNRRKSPFYGVRVCTSKWCNILQYVPHINTIAIVQCEWMGERRRKKKKKECYTIQMTFTNINSSSFSGKKKGWSVLLLTGMVASRVHFCTISMFTWRPFKNLP